MYNPSIYLQIVEETAEVDAIHTLGQSPLLVQLTLCGYCQLLVHISCQASCDLVFKCQPIKSHVSLADATCVNQ